MHALVLNASYEPLGVVPDRRALVLVLTGKAVSVQDSDTLVHSVAVEIAAPAVVRLARYVRIPHRAHVPLTRRAVFARDAGRCAYCGAPATSIDHVVPRSRGGTHTWDNVVAACQRCNHRKGDRTLAELGWQLRHTPAAPSGLAWRVLGRGSMDPRWVPYLDGHQDGAAHQDGPQLGVSAHHDGSHHDGSHRDGSHRDGSTLGLGPFAQAVSSDSSDSSDEEAASA